MSIYSQAFKLDLNSSGHDLSNDNDNSYLVLIKDLIPFAAALLSLSDVCLCGFRIVSLVVC